MMATKMTAAQREALQEAQDAKDREKTEKVYNDSMVNTPAAPKTRKVMGGTNPRNKAAMEAAGMAKGGMVPRGYGKARSKPCKMR
jgi:hypothetical protein